VYLDVRQRAVGHRNRGKFPSDSIFIDARFNAGIHGYYESVAGRGGQAIAWLDAEVNGGSLRPLAEARIRALVRSAG